jgi:hypothetical protein
MLAPCSRHSEMILWCEILMGAYVPLNSTYVKRMIGCAASCRRHGGYYRTEKGFKSEAMCAIIADGKGFALRGPKSRLISNVPMYGTYVKVVLSQSTRHSGKYPPC